VAAGTRHTLALKADGTVWSWGFNYFGQLGDGTTKDKLSPMPIIGLTNVTYIAAGDFHSLAVKTDGTVWAWGYNSSGQLGDGTTTDSNIPVQVSSITNVKSVSAGGNHSLALKTDGTVWSWGYNWYGQLGDGTATYRETPVQVRTNTTSPATYLTGITSVTAGGSHSLAVKDDGTVWAWGNNNFGQLGDGGWANKTTPMQVSSLKNVSSVSAGDSYSLALKSDDTVWSWGDGYYGQLGVGMDKCAIRFPIQIQALEPVPVSLGFKHGAYRKKIPSDGESYMYVEAAGYNDLGVEIEGLDGIVYSLASTYSGVSINAATGEVTISSAAQPGVVGIAAAYEGLTATTNIVLVPATALEINAVSGKEYLIYVKASEIANFVNVEFTFSYDSNVFNLVDIFAFTKEPDIFTGLIPGSDITVTQVSAGEIEFTVNKTVPLNKTWSGVITVIRLRATATGSGEATVSIT